MKREVCKTLWFSCFLVVYAGLMVATFNADPRVSLMLVLGFFILGPLMWLAIDQLVNMWYGKPDAPGELLGGTRDAEAGLKSRAASMEGE